MKIICKKNNNVRKMLELMRQLLETESIDYPLLEDDLILDISLKDNNGQSSPKNKESFSFDQQDVLTIENNTSLLEYYYTRDALTKLYNRGKYERDIAKLEAGITEDFTCIYIDAVGLHEINNHLGHAAGDQMLCSIARGICQYFSQSTAYRIGGDEFVIFCFHQTDAELNQGIARLKEFLSQDNYEISVGLQRLLTNLPLIETINQAEKAMRCDKVQFYRQKGDERQIRGLNHKLEKILLEKQDANQFLNVIASEYKGVYMVNPDDDTCRYIYIPEYFRDILDNNNNIFSKSIQEYCSSFVCEKDQPRFHAVFDYASVLKQIKSGNQINIPYQKKDGSYVRLQITIYDPNSLDSNEMLWIFLDTGKSSQNIN